MAKEKKQLLVDSIEFKPTEIAVTESIEEIKEEEVIDIVIPIEETEIESESEPIIVPKVIDIVNSIPASIVHQSPKNDHPYDIRPGFIQYRKSGNFDLHPKIFNFMIDPNLRGGTVTINKEDEYRIQQFLSSSNLYQYETQYNLGNTLLNIRFRQK